MVHYVGNYGFIPVYRDDSTTPNIDEGAEPGDIITFKINDEIADANGPDNNIWTSNGDNLNVDLSVATQQTGDTMTVSYPTGFDKNNTRVLNFEIYWNNEMWWGRLGTSSSDVYYYPPGGWHGYD